MNNCMYLYKRYNIFVRKVNTVHFLKEEKTVTSYMTNTEKFVPQIFFGVCIKKPFCFSRIRSYAL